MCLPKNGTPLFFPSHKVFSKVILCLPFCSLWFLIQSIQAHPNKGISLHLPLDFTMWPQPLSYIYAYWDVKQSREEEGWYLAKVMSIDIDGNCVLK